MKFTKKNKRNVFFNFLFIYFTVTVLITLFIIIFFYKEIKYQAPIIPQNVISKTIDKTYTALINYKFSFSNFFSLNDNFYNVNLNVKFKDLNILQNVSLADSNNSGSNSVRRDVKVNAKIDFNNKSYLSTIRLKGDRDIHWKEKNKFSYRVKIKNNKTILGMNEFSIQRPIVRNYIREWIFHKFLEFENLININYEFINFSVNGEQKGIYVLEQHLDKYLLENNKKRSSPIFYFDDNQGNNVEQNWESFSIKYYQSSYWDKKNFDLVNRGFVKLKKFQKHELNFYEVFDIKIFAKFFAICDILQTYHGTIPNNLKLYFNPITELFEPIGYDGHFLDKDYPVVLLDLDKFRNSNGFWNMGSWFKRILLNLDGTNNVLFYESYLNEINKITGKGYLENFFDTIKTELNNVASKLNSQLSVVDMHSSHPLTGISPLFYFDENEIYERRQYIKNKLNLFNPIQSKLIAKDKNFIVVEFLNKSILPITIRGINYNNEFYVPSNYNLINSKSANIKHTNKKIKLIKSNQNETLEIKNNNIIFYELLNKKKLYQNFYNFKLQPLKMNISNNSETFLKDTNQLDKKDIFLGPGHIVLDKSILILKENNLIIEPGTTIDFVNSSRIFSYGSIHIKGKKNNRIKFISTDNTGSGIKVLNSKKKSIINFLEVRNQNVSLDYLTKSLLTFYNSDVDIFNSTFYDNQAEDIVNVIDSDFHIENLTITNASTDAIDLDYSEGLIKNIVMEKIGNDGIDFSFSNSEINNIRLNKIGDKGISIGENSKVVADKILVSNSNIGFAIKDSSYLQLLNSEIEDSNIGFAIFQKKENFSNAQADIWRHLNTNLKNEFLIEKNSIVYVDGILAEENASKLYEKLY